TVDEVDGDVVTGRIRVKVGPISLTYSGKATFTDKDAAAHAVRVEAAGKETRGAGTASATVQANLDEEDGQTRVRVHTSLNVTGRPAQFGRGVMAEVGGRLIEKFSANLAEQLASGSGAGPAAGETATAGATAAAAETATAGEDRPKAADARLGIPIQELNLPVRSYNTLKGEGIDTVGQLVARTESDLLAIKNIGERSVEEIAEKLRDIGLKLAEGEPDTAGSDGIPAAANGGPSAAAARQDRASLDGSAAEGQSAEPAAQAAPVGEGEDADDALDLLGVAAAPILKRLLPAVGAVIALIFVGNRLRRRRGKHRAG
ncbi:MAG TPA: DNA-directed RNA polymerase subunit alpha C-terminal domain-containing protein, partial [Streptosporangiaceae bacterium]|nr:DNA-directed RNA polymerase subunit alpha C-terminal domain-containing protein [Streptosporangiaceae bacterium]